MDKQFEFTEIKGDLFKQTDPDTSLAHCVSRDFKMGAGIATLFRKKFDQRHILVSSNFQVGQVAISRDGNRFIYNLVTKEKYFQKPTNGTVREALVFMKNHAVQNNVRSIAMPRIGCGLDKLNWNTVRTMIKEIFKDTDIKISVYYL